MELLDEVEQMARNAVNLIDVENCQEASDTDIARWQQLFGYSYAKAAELIKQRRGDLSRQGVSDDHWEMVRTEKEAQVYDREAYEHEVEIGGKPRAKPPTTGAPPLSPTQARAMYLIKLDGILDTPEKIQDAAGLDECPDAIQATRDDGRSSFFCTVDGKAKHTITHWLTMQNLLFEPTFVRLFQRAPKVFSNNSIYPTLGQDSTLPQYRLATQNTTILPSQDQYPVWYFFYGKLADVCILQRRLSLPETEFPVLKCASVSRGILATWGGKYKALLDGDVNSQVNGSAYLVMSKEDEDALRAYETDNYEVVRCTITMKEEKAHGCTFRFVGTPDTVLNTQGFGWF
jgi:hypothetical protein